jgi:hypothetical protein
LTLSFVNIAVGLLHQIGFFSGILRVFCCFVVETDGE